MSKEMQNGSLYKAVVDDRSFEISPESIEKLDCVQNGASSFHVLNNRKSYAFRLVDAHPAGKRYTFACNGKTFTVQLFNRTEMRVESLGLRENGSQHIHAVEAPMPGLVLSVAVGEGQQVEAGQPLMILEAMKMENVITSPRNGTIDAIKAVAGDTVDKRQVLITFS